MFSKSKQASLPSNEILTQIDLILQDLYVTFTDAFSGGKNNKPDQLAFHNAALFNELWNKLSKPADFSNAKEIASDYALQRDGLDLMIANYFCSSPEAQIKPHIKFLFEQIISLHEVFTHLRFLITRIALGGEEFTKAIRQLKTEVDEIAKTVNDTSIEQQTETINEFEWSLRRVQQVFRLKKDSDVLNERAHQNCIATIRNQLDRLSITEQLNETIKEIHDAYDHSKQTIIDKCKVKINEGIKELEDIKNRLQKLISAYADDHDKQQQYLIKQANSLGLLLDQKEHNQNRLEEIYNHVLNLKGESFTSVNIQGYPQLKSVAEQVNNACKKCAPNKVWDEVIQKINLHTTKLSNDLAAFTDLYIAQGKKIVEIKKQVAELRSTLTKTTPLSTRIQNVVQAAREIVSECVKTLDSWKKDLEQHIENGAQYVASFIRRKWPKLTLGGAVSGTGLLVVTALTVPVSPLSAAIFFFAGFLFGIGAAGGVCLAEDEIQRKKEVKNKQSENNKPPPAQAKEVAASSGSSDGGFRLSIPGLPNGFWSTARNFMPGDDIVTSATYKSAPFKRR